MLVSAGVTIVTEEHSFAECAGEVLTSIFDASTAKSRQVLSDVTTPSLGLYASTAYQHYELPTVLVAGETLQDYCFAQALSRMRPRVIWIPSWIGKGWARVDAKEANGLSDAFYFMRAIQIETEYGQINTNEVQVTSLSLGKADLDSLIQSISKKSARGVMENWSSCESNAIKSYDALRFYEANNTHRPSVENVTDQGVIKLFSGKRPKCFASIPPQHIRWISEIRFNGLQIPRHPVIGPWMIPKTTKEVRAAKNSLCFVNVNMLVRGGDDDEIASSQFNIRLPYAELIFAELALNSSMTLASSDKGIYSGTLIQKLGGLLAATAFLRGNLGINLIQLYQSKDNNECGIWLSDERRRYLDFDSFSSLCSDVAEASSTADRFYERQIFHRGFVFRCEFCRRTSWYAVSETSESFTCKRCHRSQLFTRRHWRSPNQPLWYNQLDEVVYQAIISDSHVPILAMGYLQRESKLEFTYSAELAYSNDNGTRWMESDINCIADGRLTVGEAKKENRLAATAATEREAADRYLQLAKRLNAAQVVFATLQPAWRTETTRIIKNVFAGNRQELVFLCKDQLLGSQ